MNYADYAGPSAGYVPYQQPSRNYTTGNFPPRVFEPKSGVGTFRELVVTTDGYGDFHVNHFVVLSDVVADPLAECLQRAEAMTWALSVGFPTVFSERNVAKASWRKPLFKQLPTVEFEVGGSDGTEISQVLGAMHSDWVAMQNDPESVSFFARTLKRQWLIGAEKFTDPDDPAAQELVDVSQRHVLAGRRSWKVGFAPELKRYFVETATVERNSSAETELFDLATPIPRTMVVQVWSLMLQNFISHGDAQRIPWTTPSKLTAFAQAWLPGYSELGNVLYRVEALPDFASTLALPWYQPVLGRHPWLTRGII